MDSDRSQQRRDNRLVIGVTGHIGAGKTSAANYLKDAHGFFYVRYSKVLSDWLAKDAKSKAHLQIVGWEVMAGGMQRELNTRLITQIPAQVDAAADGLRHPIDHESLTQAFPSQFRLLYIESRQRTRWQRVRKRYAQLDTFRRADSHAVEQQIDALRGRAFEVLENDGTLEDLYSKVEAVLKKIRAAGGHL
jgi:dephospho-CoA kinase